MDRKIWIFRGISISAGFVAILLIIEIILRFYPVRETFYHLPLNEDNPVTRYEPNKTITWSQKYNFSVVTNVRLNNYGFNSAIDYEKESTLPLITVIGDSYIEAFMVPLNETGHALLGDKLEKKARVYNFASSNVSLCGYAEYAKWAKDIFKPQKIIVLIISNDFDASLIKYRQRKFQNHYKEEKNGSYSIVRVGHKNNPLKALLYKSKLVSYLVLNIQVKRIPGRIRAFFSSEKTNRRYVSNVEAKVGPDVIMDSKKVTDYFLETLPENSGLSKKDILFVVDGYRPFPYTDEDLDFRNNSYFGTMRKYFINRARESGYEVIDLNPVFCEDYKKNMMVFSVPGDGHWNSRGHRMFFESVYGSGFLNEYK